MLRSSGLASWNVVETFSCSSTGIPHTTTSLTNERSKTIGCRSWAVLDQRHAATVGWEVRRWTIAYKCSEAEEMVLGGHLLIARRRAGHDRYAARKIRIYRCMASGQVQKCVGKDSRRAWRGTHGKSSSFSAGASALSKSDGLEVGEMFVGFVPSVSVHIECV